MARKRGGNLMGRVSEKRTGGAQPRNEGTAGSPVGTKRKAPKGSKRK